MTKRTSIVLLVACTAVMLTGGSLMASNMGFKLNLPLFAITEEVPEGGNSSDGTNTIALPYNKQTGIVDAATLGADIGGFDPNPNPAQPVINIQRLNRDGNVLDFYDGGTRGGSVNFPLIDGNGYRVRVNTHVDYIVVGSHDPSLPVTLYKIGSGVPEGGNSTDGTNKYGYPYHSTAGDAAGLGAEIGGFDPNPNPAQPVINIQRLNRDGNILDFYDGGTRGGSVNFTLIPGDAYRVRVNTDVTFVPSHF